MILSFRHKGLRRFYETGDTRGIQASHASKLRDILFALSYAKQAQDMELPGFRLHLLEPRNAGVYAVSVSGNWRVTFCMNGENVEIVDYLDYH